VTITETVSLNGQDKGSTNSMTIASVAEVLQRIITVPTSEMTVLTFTSSTPGSSTAIGLNEANIRYIRMTNKDDTNFIQITTISDGNNECAHKLEAGHSLMIPVSEEGTANVHDADSSALTVSFGDLASVTALANTSACDLEIFVAGV
jgi:hypothetical protein